MNVLLLVILVLPGPRKHGFAGDPDAPLANDAGEAVSEAWSSDEVPLPRHLTLSGTDALPAETGERSVLPREAPSAPLIPGDPALLGGLPQDPPQDSKERPPPHGSWDGVGEHFSAKAWRAYVWDDYLTTPKVLLPAFFAVSAAAISHWDRRLQQHWYGVLGNRGWYSDAGQYTLLAAVVLDGLFLPGEGRNWWDEAWTIGEAYMAASLTTFTLKTAVMRPRPGSQGSQGSGTHSFPSGHSTSAFTSATLIHENSGPAFGLPAYGLAAFTAFERVEEGRHFPSDVLAGAAIGTLSAGILDALHWGRDGRGGIARPGDGLALDMDGLKGFSLTFMTRF